MSESGHDVRQSLAENPGEAIMHEYEVRMLNNKLFELVNSSELSLKTIEQIDALLAMKARLILDGFSETFPAIADALREMLAALHTAKPGDDTSDLLEDLHEILQDLMEAKHAIDPYDEERLRELDRMIELIEYILAAHVTESRTS